MATDYNKLYAESDNVCGAPFKELIAFFNDISATKTLKILDAGCGQGRDTLLMAVLGHIVHAMDTSPIGIQQILTQAATQHLSITAEVADIRSYTTHKQFDVVLIDRVLHMLSADERIPTLERYLGLVATSGFLLLMDTPANIKPFNQFLKKTDDWKTCLQTNNTLFTQKIS